MAAKNLYDTLNEDVTGVPPEEEVYSLEEILAEYGGGRRKKILEDVEERATLETAEALAAEIAKASAPQTSGPVQIAADLPLQPQAAPRRATTIPAPDAPPERSETADVPEKSADNGAESDVPLPQTPPPMMTPPPVADKETFQRETAEQAQRQAEVNEALHKEELPDAPKPITMKDISMEEVVSRTVDAVMEERKLEPGPLLPPKRGLFSRKKLVETEEIHQRPETPPGEPAAKPKQVIKEETFDDAAARFRKEYRSRRGPVLAAGLIALLISAPFAAEVYGYKIPVWTEDVHLQSIILLTCLMMISLLARHVFGKGFSMLVRRKRCVSELLASMAALVSMADCGAVLLLPSRTAVTPYAAVTCWTLVFAMFGGSRESRGDWETFRAAAVDNEPPYLVTETGTGACKQSGAVPGFYTAAVKDDLSTIWQTALLPVVLAASIVFAVLSSIGQGRPADFFLNWSAILTAGATLALPLCWGLPWSRLARHLLKIGCAVAGWVGAEKISRKKTMVVTDADLFPPGTVLLNGVKTYGEEVTKVTSYAATLARSAGSGLERVFDRLLRSEGGQYETADDFSFFEEGGYSASIHGETVLLGTASFMRKMNIRMPGNITLKTGLFLAIDRQLSAAFAVKYQAAENVDFALRIMRRSHITPILASRDPNITPALLKRKFHKGVKVEYPDLTSRVALSEAEEDKGLPRALLFREGLLPYAGTVVGSRRLCKAVRQSTALSMLGSITGTLLSFYFVFQKAYSLLSPPALLLFLLLWALPVLLLSDWTGRY